MGFCLGELKVASGEHGVLLGEERNDSGEEGTLLGGLGIACEIAATVQ